MGSISCCDKRFWIRGDPREEFKPEAFALRRNGKPKQLTSVLAISNIDGQTSPNAELNQKVVQTYGFFGFLLKMVTFFEKYVHKYYFNKGKSKESISRNFPIFLILFFLSFARLFHEFFH